MKQTIRQVLDDMKDSQINLGSESARETIASLVSAALKTKGTYTEYDDSEIEEQKAREAWVCNICNKSTYDVENDYIGSGTNHLGCELEIEMGNKEDDIDHYTERWPGLDKIMETEKNKLSEAIVDNRPDGDGTEWLYESEDGGKTIYKRKFGSDERELVKDTGELYPWHKEKGDEG
tara:strand:+ start:808 stop:1338 length:531 start_codon:yes stop_codon:yes gene_type:complete